MEPVIKQYLQEHKQELDNLELFFDNIYDSILSNGTIANMCSYLALAGIADINKYRDKSLDKILSMCVYEFVALTDPSEFAVPINDFIETYLTNRLGYSVYYVKEYIINHASRWKKLVEIYEDENSIPMIRRRNV